MYANFTEETATGTGDTLTLSGATSGSIPFSASFEDGDLVAYVIEDSGGAIKVAGIGTYNSGSITRSDTWHYNGAVVNKNPSSNIGLSSGQHVVRCAQDESMMPPIRRLTGSTDESNSLNISLLGADGGDGSTDRNSSDTEIRHALVKVPTKSTLSKITFFVSIGAAGGLARVGVVRMGANGQPDKVLTESSDVDISTSGKKEVSVPPVFFTSEDFVLVYMITNTNDAQIESLQRFNFYEIGAFLHRNASQNYRVNPCMISLKTGGTTDLAYPVPIPSLGGSLGLVNDAYVPRFIIEVAI